MGFEYLTNTPLDKARDEYLSHLTKNGLAPKTETIPVHQSAGRVTAGPVYAENLCAAL